MGFKLDEQLERETVKIKSLAFCDLLLNRERIGPWLILVPRVMNKTEIYQLTEAEQGLLMKESSMISEMLSLVFKADKINIAALGNLVSQLHVHHIARFHHDGIWPKPIWGHTSGALWEDSEIEQLQHKIQHHLECTFDSY